MYIQSGMTTMTKKAIEVATQRFGRKANGKRKRVKVGVVRKLGRLYGEDTHFRFLRLAGDKLERRAQAGGILREWMEGKKYGTKYGADRDRHLAYFYFSCGPNHGRPLP